ncbi:hypothetical protein [Dictyobacter halimunensis]|uniref:hypothetical protein n=1 Tax=Dictyobacter halimunensis TaxID=3026934 RepID=UPI0030C67B77
MSKTQRQIGLIICCWLCLLMAGDTLLHIYYTLFAFSSSWLLPFLSGFIYLISGLFLGAWSRLALRHAPKISIPMRIALLLALSLGIVLIIIGYIFFTSTIQQLPRIAHTLYQPPSL